MKVAVLGAGAIGAYVGAALHRAGADVHLVARGPHLAAMRQHGVRVLSPRGDFTARARATDDPAEIGPVDFVFLGLKANAYAACGPLIEPLLHEGTAVVAAQNGIPWWYFHRHGGTRRVIEIMMNETLAVAAALGCEPGVSVARRLAGAERVGDHRTSTLQDLERGKPLELDVLLAAVVELADATGVPVPTLRTVHAISDLLASRTAS
ncbi:2-dehydropantoate 2-reductase N-terminal domain-containing protein [Streptomyces luteocolor]|uniref:2-dehydropantoate 2-reductase N-terminal domain-containing protein n=1 Tax=Streptomyces luteocolor TaxID=285500 RepID=UPI0008536274|nr:2-dehydropantoate 2-reductase N-terminal domain-containing protein [Streptomyces luteocolor]